MEPLGASGADKKRNKLGYHRTSVACVHCRRRKIRCLVAADDRQGRCENCIRLHKECQFYPVEQQPPPSDHKFSRPGGMVASVAGGLAMETPSSSADPSIASSSPPPSNALGGIMDPNDMYHPYQQLALHSAATTPEMAAVAGGFPPAGFPVASMGSFAGNPGSQEGIARPDIVPGQTIHPNAPYNMGNPSPAIWTHDPLLAGSPSGQPPHPHIASASGLPHHPQMLNPAVASGSPYQVRTEGAMWPGPPQRAMTTIPSQPEMYHPHPHQAAMYGASVSMHPPDLKRTMTSPATAPAPGQFQPSQLHSPPPTQIAIDYSGQPIQYQHHGAPAPASHHPQPAAHPEAYPQWDPNMNAIQMADGTYGTIFAPPPDHYPMGNQQHPGSGS